MCIHRVIHTACRHCIISHPLVSPIEGSRVLWWTCLFVCLSVCLSFCLFIMAAYFSDRTVYVYSPCHPLRMPPLPCYYYTPSRGSAYCDESVCLSVFLHAYLKNICTSVNLLHVTCGHGWILLYLHCNTLSIVLRFCGWHWVSFQRSIRQHDVTAAASL